VVVVHAIDSSCIDAGVSLAASASATEPPLRVEAIANATQAVAPATIRFDANIRGGASPYSYSWSVPDLGVIDQDRSITQMFFEPGTFTYSLTVTDSRGKVVTDNVQIVISERVPTEGIVAPEPGGIAPPPLEGGVSPGVPEGGEGEEPEGGVSPPSTTEEEEEGGEEPPAPPPPSSDDTGGGEESPPSTTTKEEPTTPSEGGGG
jgi:PKD repeat protein